MINRWNFTPLTDEQEKQKMELAEALGCSPVLCQLLVQRGITTFAQAKSFFRPQLTDLHDPFLMNDMEKAVDRLNRAIGNKERILVYGDYDVDGITAVALVYKLSSNSTPMWISTSRIVIRKGMVSPTRELTMRWRIKSSW